MRNLIGYGANIPDFHWPNKAKLALNFVINYEEGSERSLEEGDNEFETYLVEPSIDFGNTHNKRNLYTEDWFEYGSRVGIWRLINLFDYYQIPITFFATGRALELNPPLCQYLRQSTHELCCRPYRWLNNNDIAYHDEKNNIELSLKTIEKLTSKKPVGWFGGKNILNSDGIMTRQILSEMGMFLYDSDAYDDDLPYWDNTFSLLVIPYTLDTNDIRYCLSPGYSNENDFFMHLKLTFDYLYTESKKCPKLLTIALHARISGRPARTMILKKLIDYIKPLQRVWFCRRMDIASFWLKYQFK